MDDDTLSSILRAAATYDAASTYVDGRPVNRSRRIGDLLTPFDLLDAFSRALTHERLGYQLLREKL